MLISVILPCYNEAAVLHEAHRRLAEVAHTIADATFEFLFVDDGSSDETAAILHQLSLEDARVRGLRLSRNFGQQIATTAGLEHATGDAVVIMDADLQDPPELMQEMVVRWREGYHVAYAERSDRAGETRFKLWSAKMFYRLVNRISHVQIPADTGDFRLMDRKVVDVLKQMKERHRFPRGMSAWVGFKQIGVKYKRSARTAGVTKYPFNKMLKLALNAITSFSYFPLQVATFFGFVSAGISILAIPIVIYMRIMGSGAFTGQATTLIAVLFLGGVQLISLGILGEYIGRLYDEAKGRPLYIVREAPQD